MTADCWLLSGDITPPDVLTADFSWWLPASNLETIIQQPRGETRGPHWLHCNKLELEMSTISSVGSSHTSLQPHKFSLCFGVDNDSYLHHLKQHSRPLQAVFHHHQRIFVISSPENLSQCLCGINNSFFVRISLDWIYWKPTVVEKNTVSTRNWHLMSKKFCVSRKLSVKCTLFLSQSTANVASQKLHMSCPVSTKFFLHIRKLITASW